MKSLALTLVLVLSHLVIGCAGPDAGGTPSVSAAPVPGIQLTPGDAYKIGRKIWQNECGGTKEGLTSWNAGENFASLGIGHFIWYPAGVRGPYEESFPKLMGHLQAQGVALPVGIKVGPCPWRTKAEFEAAKRSPEMTALRDMLHSTVPIQASFLVNRFLQGTRKVVDATPALQKELVEHHIQALAATPNGLYAMMDYVNFKGEGTNPSERYQGQGWGLQQVLMGMQGQPIGQDAAREFARSAKDTLSRRISLAPKNETQWKAGWHKRCESYAAPF